MYKIINNKAQKISRHGRFIKAAAAAVLLCVFVSYAFFTRADFSSRLGGHIAVCTVNARLAAVTDRRTVFINDDSASGFYYSPVSKTLFYRVNSSFSPGTFDLYCINNEKKSPLLLDFGVDSKFYVDICGNKVYYIKYDPSVRNSSAFCAVPGGGEPQSLIKNVEEIFYDGQDGIWFTRMLSGDEALYSRSLSHGGETLLSKKIISKNFFSSVSGSEMFFECGGDGGSGVQLNVVYPGDRPLLISGNIIKAEYSSYSPGGNLYYYTLSGDGLSWQQVITDSLVSADEAAAEPEKDNYVSFFGLSPGYESDRINYENKLTRDRLRAALDENFLKSEVCAPIYDAYVYNKSGSQRLAAGIDPNRVRALCPDAEPKIVYSAFTALAPVDLTDLVGPFVEGGFNAVINAVDKAFAAGGGVTENRISSFCDGCASTVTAVGFPAESEFEFSPGGSVLYAFGTAAGGKTAYYSRFVGGAFKSAKSIDSGIISHSLDGGDLVYLKQGDNGAKSVFRFSGGEKSVVSQNSAAFVIRSDKCVYSFKKPGVGSLASLYYCGSGNEKLLLDNVLVKSVCTGSDSCTALLCGGGKSSALYYCSGQKIKQAAKNVESILFFY